MTYHCLESDANCSKHVSQEYLDGCAEGLRKLGLHEAGFFASLEQFFVK